MKETPLQASPVFARADGCSGSNYTCNGCGCQWGDHISPGIQCPETAQSHTALEKAKSSDARAAGIQNFAMDAWTAHASGLAIIKPLSKTLKSKVIGKDSARFPLYASSVRVEGHGVATSLLCMTNDGNGLCTVISVADENEVEFMLPVAVTYNVNMGFLPAVKKHLYFTHAVRRSWIIMSTARAAAVLY